ncbi:unnamed protein product [Paramecium pentaurelia]|uniref:Uncharacterized protein n=1 Tax=Paramecium pentaurelia TaxID=43138 RepID=A0A8S1YHG9_9CILI|nr:unnamed protein product [Paramecium pentaurelia]
MAQIIYCLETQFPSQEFGQKENYLVILVSKCLLVNIKKLKVMGNKYIQLLLSQNKLKISCKIKINNNKFTRFQI